MPAATTKQDSAGEAPPPPPLPNPSTAARTLLRPCPLCGATCSPRSTTWPLRSRSATTWACTPPPSRCRPRPARSGGRAAHTRQDKGKASGTDLYDQLDRYYADAAREIFLGAPTDDSSLVHYLVPCFNRYSAGAQAVSRLLNYVNRHYVKRAVDEDRGWLRLADVLDAVARTIQEDDTREKIQRRLRERRTEELKKFGFVEGASPADIACIEEYAEAASPPDRVVHLSAVAYRRFRIEVLDPLLAAKKKKPPQTGDKPSMPKGRLARSVKELLESEGGDEEERRRLGGGLAIAMRTCGIKVDHPLRKKLDKYIPPAQPTAT
ncbi:uncharacterized protein B0H18DRAFT_1024541 [Fomitopsis serialis]|uniref:uncharacterized protein n=1 Tax=Fomitopsis serialis TaxID=139415 RepID=UPI00200828AC